MVIKKVSILLPLFIFGIIPQGWADFVKTMKQPANQITTIKMDENKVVLPPITEQWSMVSNGINLLKTLEQKKNLPLVDLLSQVIFYPSSQNDWRDKILNFKKVAEIKSSNPDFDPSGFRRHPNGNNGFEEEGILTTLKLLQSKGDEIFKEISMGLRFSFRPTSRKMFLEMNITPSSDKGQGFMLPF